MKKKGFTLIEIIISIVIISVSFYTLINVLTSVTYKNVNSQQLLVASFLAEETMEEFTAVGKNWGTDIISRVTQNYGGDFANFYNTINVFYVEDTDLNTEAAGSTDYKRVEVIVTGEALNMPVRLIALKANY